MRQVDHLTKNIDRIYKESTQNSPRINITKPEQDKVMVPELDFSSSTNSKVRRLAKNPKKSTHLNSSMLFNPSEAGDFKELSNFREEDSGYLDHSQMIDGALIGKKDSIGLMSTIYNAEDPTNITHNSLENPISVFNKQSDNSKSNLKKIKKSRSRRHKQILSKHDNSRDRNSLEAIEREKYQRKMFRNNRSFEELSKSKKKPRYRRGGPTRSKQRDREREDEPLPSVTIRRHFEGSRRKSSKPDRNFNGNYYRKGDLDKSRDSFVSIQTVKFTTQKKSKPNNELLEP